MNLFFAGPFPFEAKLALAHGRAALSSVGAAMRANRAPQPQSARLDQPGLYIILSGEPSTILGFWIVFGAGFLDDGPAGPPERVPPYAAGLLDAATEEVWWRTLRVKTDSAGSWRPLIVLDWPSALAVRSLVAPPGVAAAHDAGPSPAQQEEESWLDVRPGTPSRVAAPVFVEPVQSVSDPWAGLPQTRGLVTVIRGALRYTASLHTGRWTLVPPAALGAADNGAIALEIWLQAAESGDAAGGGAPALWLPGGRVASPLAGWLTRALEPWPTSPDELAEGTLSAREVGTKWKALVVRSLGSTLAVLLGVGGLAGAVRLAAEPRPQPLPVTPLPAPQPAMSVCSADHQAFVGELRCQVARMSASSETVLSEPICGDAGSPGAPPDPGEDLQAALCGLIDREIDGWTGNRVARDTPYNFGELALSQACFNVLGRPYSYTQPGGFAGGRPVADPGRFLDDPDLGIASLIDADARLRASCERVRIRAEARVEGAIFATHLGGPAKETRSPDEPEASTLRRKLLRLVRSGLSGEATRCFDAGVRGGTPWPGYSGVCGPGDPADEALEKVGIWQRLGGEGGTGDVVARYVSARFGLAGGTLRSTQSELWSCHLALVGVAESRSGWARSLWDLVLPVPRVYNTNGSGADSQIVLDSGMRAFEAGLDAGVCWDVVKRRLTDYTPVHPLLAELDEDDWPSVEQRLCGQVCASAFRLAPDIDGEVWLSPESDLRLCLNDAPPTDPPDFGRGALDTLRMPWNGNPWRTPSAAKICAFNLVAQGYLSAGEGPGGKAPVQWAGETAAGSRIAGGPAGLAADAVAGMQRYGAGSGWSVGRCSFVATQCFAELLLEITGDPAVERYEWLPRWNSAINSLAATKASVLADKHPWCAPLAPYLGDSVDLAQIDTPCRRGVDEARGNIERAARRYAAGATGEEAP